MEVPKCRQFLFPFSERKDRPKFLKMLKVLKHCRINLELHNYFSTAAVVKCNKSENNEPNLKKLTNDLKEKGEKNDREKKSRGRSQKNYYVSSLSEEEKSEAKTKMKNLIENMRKERLDEKIFRSTTSVAQSARKAARKGYKMNEESLKTQIRRSAKEVAGHLGGNVAETEKNLLVSFEAFGSFKGSKENIEKFSTPKGLHDKDVSKSIASSLQNITKIDYEKKRTASDLFSTELGIFNQHRQHSKVELQLKIWDNLETEELKLMSSCPPRNYFEELIMWTEQNKLWHFPIDNDQGMDKEAKVDFTEHIFLEDHLEDWCPKSGPLRHFMELVLIGLSKNPYLSVQDKKEHINWFKEYFENKKKLLIDVGAFTSCKEANKSEEKVTSKN